MPPKRARADSDTFPEEVPNSTRGSAPPKKRARFAEDEDDIETTIILNDIDDNLETRARRGRVKVEGYESDSTDEGESVVRSRRRGADGDDDDDMFAIASDEEKSSKTQGGTKKKSTKWMSLGDIDGQEFGGGSAGEGDDKSVSESDPEDEDDRIRRSKAGMGYEFTRFNMKEEMEEGKFAEDGTYVRSFDQHQVHDRWLEDVDEKEMKRARRAKRKAERIERERIREEERQSGTAEQNQTSMEMELLAIMLPGETVLEALARLGKDKKKKEAGAGATKKKRKLHGPVQADPDVMSSKAPPLLDIDRITTISSKLLPSLPEIYSTPYEAILRSVRRSQAVPDDWVPPKPKFEYKWTVEAATTHGVNGPFTEEEVRTWFSAGYFGDFGERIALRVVGTEEWKGWDEVFGT
jgi:CD2 antigen cytoplasmic tail-binding protein 2